jgi:hypothetical protein
VGDLLLQEHFPVLAHHLLIAPLPLITRITYNTSME